MFLFSLYGPGAFCKDNKRGCPRRSQAFKTGGIPHTGTGSSDTLGGRRKLLFEILYFPSVRRIIRLGFKDTVKSEVCKTQISLILLLLLPIAPVKILFPRAQGFQILPFHRQALQILSFCNVGEYMFFRCCRIFRPLKPGLSNWQLGSVSGGFVLFQDLCLHMLSRLLRP